jgi:hypothetical protein
MTLAEFRDATAAMPPETTLLILDLCGLVSPAMFLTEADCAADDPVLPHLTETSILLASDPV